MQEAIQQHIRLISLILTLILTLTLKVIMIVIKLLCLVDTIGNIWKCSEKIRKENKRFKRL